MPIPGGGPLILSQLSASGPPAVHGPSHDENASDEIFVENLGAISVVTTDALMPDGAGGLVFGSPAPAAHALGGALHIADTLANLNAKVSDAVLVDSADVMLLDGTQAMTGTMTTRQIVPDGDGTREFGSSTAVWNIGWFRTLRPDSGQDLVFRLDSGSLAFNIESGVGVRFSTTTRFQNAIPVLFGTTAVARLQFDSTQTNSHFIIGADSTTNVILITDQDRVGTLDLAIPAQTTPQLWLHDGSLAINTIGRVYQSTTQLRFESRDVAGSVETIVSGVFLWRVNAIGGTLQKIGGADPIDNTTGLDSRKIGFETRVWDGAAPQTRTYSIRAEDVSGTDDQSRLVFSSDDNGGAERDFLTILQESGGGATFRAGSANTMTFEKNDGTNFIEFRNTGDIILTSATMAFATSSALRMDNNRIINFGSASAFQLMYGTTSQTNNTLLFGTQGTEGNTVVFTDKARLTLDHVVGTPSTPTWRWHDGSATAGNWGSITHDGANLVIVPNVGAVRINQSTNMRSLEIDSEATSQPVINILSPATTTGPVFDVDDADALTTGQIINLKSNSASVAARALVRIHNDNTLAVGAIPLDIIQDAAKEAAALDLGTLDMGFINFKATADADAVSAISTLTTSGAVQGHVQMLVNGVSRWFAFLADPS